MKMTKVQVDKLFLEEVMPYIRMKEKEFKTSRLTKDVPWRCEEYNNFIDYLYKEKMLTDKQVSTYSIPTYLIR